MFKNYLKTALRTLSRNKLYTSLNIAGLTFGISCFLLIGLYLFDELTFDSQHKEADRIYRAIQHRKTPTEDLTMAAASYKVAEESKKSIPEIEDVARIVRSGRANLTNPDNNKTFQETVTIGSAGFMQIFNFQVVEGDLSKALKEPNTIIIAEELAKRYFNSTNVIGKNMVFEFINDRPLKVTAVIKNHPRNSSFDFSSMISEATFSSDPNFEQSNSDWTAPNYMTFFLLKENANPQLVSKKVTDLLNANATWEAGNSMRFSLQPLKDMHLHSDGIVDAARNSNVDPMSAGVMLYLKIFAVVALFVLIIACINYMNLTTARASNRSKEIGVRKATGAHRSHLIYQFLTESILVTIISFILAVVVVNIILPGFNKFTNKELSLGFDTDSRLWFYSILAVTVTGLLAGSYPALLLSGFKPQLLLKTFKIQNKGDLSLRKSLVVFQFAISIVMIIATIVLFQQVQYVNNKNLGFNKELLLVVDINSGRVRAGAETITTGLNTVLSCRGK